MKLFKKEDKLIDSVQAHVDRVRQYREENPDIFLGCHSTDAQVALNCLQDVFLGEDWYVVDPLCNAQVNTLVLDEILYRYYKPYRKFCKRLRKINDKRRKNSFRGNCKT